MKVRTQILTRWWNWVYSECGWALPTNCSELPVPICIVYIMLYVGGELRLKYKREPSLPKSLQFRKNVFIHSFVFQRTQWLGIQNLGWIFYEELQQYEHLFFLIILKTISLPSFLGRKNLRNWIEAWSDLFLATDQNMGRRICYKPLMWWTFSLWTFLTL